MEPRLLSRTHYQVDEPVYLKIIVLRCTSASRSDFPERVALRLVEQTKLLPNPLNPAAARYAIDLAKGVGLINNNLVWTDLGQLLNCVCENQPNEFGYSLALPERLLIFHLFFSSDGAAMLYVARQIERAGSIPGADQNWSQFANEMSVSIYSEYLELIGDTQSRVKLRHALEKRRAKPFRGKSGSHQSFVHLQVLHRIGMLGKTGGTTRRYSMLDSLGREKQPLILLLERVPDVRAMEHAIQNKEWAKLAACIFSNQLPEATEEASEVSPKAFLSEFLPAYKRVIETGVQFCPISVIVEWSQISRLADGRTILEYSKALDLLKQLRDLYPREVRFHVDRTGRPTYLKIERSLAT